MTENQEQELQELELKLIEKNKYVASVEQKISFRPKGQRSKWTSELIRAKYERNLIASDIKRIEAKSVFEENEVFLKDYEEREKINKEKKRVLTLLKEYKENPTITLPIKIQKDKPDFSKIGDRIIDENEVALINAQRGFNSARQRASKRSSVGTGGRALALQKTRNRLNEAIFDVSHEPILTEFRELLAEKEWKETIIDELESEIEGVQVIISKVEADFTFFEKHGLIKPKK